MCQNGRQQTMHINTHKRRMQIRKSCGWIFNEKERFVAFVDVFVTPSELIVRPV